MTSLPYNSLQNVPILPNFVPPGCTNDADARFASSFGALGENESIHVLFPARDSYVRGGDYQG